MRILAAMFLSVTGAVTAFLAVLTALDDPRPIAAAAAPPQRLLAFAAPDLAASHATLAATLAAPAGSVARFAAPPVLAESRLEIPESAKPVRAAFVPPIARRKPVEQALPGDATVAESRPATPVGVPPVVAEAKPVRAKAPAGQPIDTSTRSALGGPRPTTGKAPKPEAAK